MTGEAYFLVGPTATGKSAVAQYIAERDPTFEILSADSMLVYKGMDIGTAKPSAEERRRVVYHGLDLETPDRQFSVGAYRRQACSVVGQAAERGKRILVVGGSGLYIKSLTAGLDQAPVAEQDRRRHWSAVLDERGVEGLREELRRLSPAEYETLADKRNARRLIRAIEVAESDAVSRRTWAAQPPSAPLCGLARGEGELRERIAARVETMYDTGLLQEVAGLKQQYPEWSPAAGQAIGYREAARHLEGEISKEEAIRQTVARTRRFAKRQRTWFRHQADVRWIDLGSDLAADAVAERVLEHWKQHGPTVVR